MAKNWSAAEAAKVVFEGQDKAAIQDIGKRFPLFVSAAARGAEGLLEIISVLHPERITARTIESKLKEGLEDIEEEDEAEEEKKPASKSAPKKGGAAKGKKKPDPEEEEDEDEEDEEEEAPKKSKSKGKSTPAKGKKKPEPEEDEDDEEDEDEDDDGLEEMSLVELKKEAKKRKVNIKGLKSPKEIIAALRAEDEEDDDDEDDDDDWDL